VNQKVAAKQLHKLGHVVSVANHGEEALNIIKQSEHCEGVENSKKLDVVLLDLEMPIMNGLTCLRKIRELQKQGMIRDTSPVIAVTANARKDQIVAMIKAGMDDVATKPFRIQELIKQIEVLVDKHTMGIDVL